KVRDSIPSGASLSAENQPIHINTKSRGLPSFVELFQPFKLPQSLQPNGEAHLNRDVLNIFSPRSEFVGQMYAAINPQAAPFVGAVLSNATSSNAPTLSPQVSGVIAVSNGEAFRLKTFIAGHNFPVVIRERLDANGATLRGTSPVIVSPPDLADYLAALKAANFPADANSD